MDERTVSKKTTFLDVLGLLNRRKWVVIITTIAGSIGVFLVALLSILLPEGRSFWPNFYVPEAHVIISDGSAGGTADLLKSAGLSSLAGLAGIGSAGPTASGLAIKVATTNSFLDTIAADFDFYNRFGFVRSNQPKTLARRMIKRDLFLTMDAGSGVMTIGYKAFDKVLATDVVNRVVDLLEEQFAVIAVDRNRTQLTLVAGRIRDVEAEMLRLQNEINSLQHRYNTFDLAAFAKDLASKLGGLRADMLQKSLEVDSYGSTIGIEDPALRRLKVERDVLRANVAKLEKGYSENGVIVPAEADLPRLVVQYTRLKGDLDVQKKIYETLVQQQELVKLQVESVPRTFQVYEKAVVPERKSGPNRPKICIVVAAASFFLGIAFAFLVDYLARTLRNPADLNRLKGKVDEE